MTAEGTVLWPGADGGRPAGTTDDPLPDLLRAAERGALMEVATLVQRHPGLVHGRGRRPGHPGERTALHLAAAGGHEGVVALLLALGADPATFDGLAGVGDLITTCVSPEGRNRTVGEQIGKGRVQVNGQAAKPARELRPGDLLEIRQADGETGMADRSSRPHHSPTQTPTRTERRIIKVRVLRRWGPARITYRSAAGRPRIASATWRDTNT